MRADLQVVHGDETFADEAAGAMENVLRRAVEARGVCRVAVSGGATPGPVYERLAATAFGRTLDPGTLDVYLADERLVPEGDPNRNARLVDRTLLGAGRWTPAALHRAAADDRDPEQAARDYDAEWPARPDLVVLGMGVDGHIASLFPGSPLLEEWNRRVAAVRGGSPDVWRITLTPRAIADARSVLVLVRGKEKALTLARVFRGPFDPARTPAHLAHEALWIADAEAARLVTA